MYVYQVDISITKYASHTNCTTLVIEDVSYTSQPSPKAKVWGYEI